jgi:hypothetical protein
VGCCEGMDVGFKVIVLRQVVRQIGLCGLSRVATVRLLTGLHHTLPVDAHSHRPNRDPRDPDCFLYGVVLNDGGMRHRCIFRVNDARATDHLFVESLDHNAGPIT